MPTVQVFLSEEMYEEIRAFSQRLKDNVPALPRLPVHSLVALSAVYGLKEIKKLSVQDLWSDIVASYSASPELSEDGALE